MRTLPPLAAVRVFEAAARHENFTSAASELGMTQAAVSYQVKLLEGRLGLQLFRREGRRVLLTEPGRRAARDVSAAFDGLDAAFAGLRAEDETLLTVNTSHTFANTWLAWRLGAFQVRHPDMAVRLQAEDRNIDFAATDVDVVIRAGENGVWPGLVSDKLLGVDFTPMCSPGFLARIGGTVVPEDLLQLTLISAQDEWWGFWLREAGVDAPIPRARSGIRLDSQANEGHAAIAGQGFAMLPFFWRNDLAEGRLVRPFRQVSTRGFSYWLAYPEHRRRVPKIKRFREWLTTEVAADLAALK